MKTSPVFFAMSRARKVAALMDAKAFPSAEYVRAAFAWGVSLPDGLPADGWGRCKNEAEFVSKAAHSQITVLSQSIP